MRTHGLVIGGLGVAALCAASLDESGAMLLNGGRGLLNPSFELWVDEKPLFWRGEGGNTVVMDRERVTDGLSAARFAGVGYYGLLIQRVELARPIAGRTLHFAGDVAASEPERVKLCIRVEEDQKTYSGVHPGDSEWHRLEAVYEFPEDDAHTAFEVILIQNEQPRTPAYFDNLGLWIE